MAAEISHTDLPARLDVSIGAKPGFPFWAALAVYVLISVIFIPLAGIQNDEALFAGPLYAPHPSEYNIRVFHHDLPLMLMSYLGTLKTAIFGLVFAIFPPGVWSLRLPVVLAGALALWLFWILAAHCLGRRAAGIAAGMLATDPVFLLTNTFDWGPVVIEHVLLLAGLVLILRFVGSWEKRPEDISGDPAGIPWNLVWGFFCLGLALWNKAIFLWALSGLVAGSIAVFLPEIRRGLTRRNVQVAIASFLLGASPFVLYNIRHRGRTVSENAQLDFASVPGKWVQMKNALNGSSLFGYLVAEEWESPPKVPETAIGRASVWVRDRLGERRFSYFYYLCGLLLLAAPWWWRRRAARFSLVFGGVTWLAMAVTRDAGGSAHHVILLWPFPILFAVVALDSLPWRKLARVAGAAIVLLNLSVLNQYLAQFERSGAANVFSDAIFPLSQALAESQRPVYVIDWGVFDALVLLRQGRLNQHPAVEGFASDAPSEMDRKQVRWVLSDPDTLIVTHVRDREIYPKVGEHLDRAAEALGYRKELWRTIADSNGRPVFEVFAVSTRGD